MSEFRFAEPEWAYALWGVLTFVLLLFWLERRGGSALGRFVSESLQLRLVARPRAWRRNLRILLLGLATTFLVIALMRPQWGLRHVVAPRIGAEIMVCLDTSKSMLAEDVAPNRLERAKAEVADLLAFLDEDQVGLIAFAGRATVLAPLTPDFGFLRLVLDNVGVHSVSRGGTRLGDAIRKAVAGFGPAGEASRAILLITDGEDHDSFPLDAAKAAAEEGIRIIAVGFGDEAGAEIYVSDPRTGARSRLLDSSGAPVRSRLDGELLRELALATEGAYIPAGTGVLDLESIYRTHIARLTRGKLGARGKSVRDEGYQWAVLLALVFLVSSTAASGRPGAPQAERRVSAGGRLLAAILLLAVALAPPQPTHAQGVEEGAELASSTQEAESVEEAAEPPEPRTELQAPRTTEPQAPRDVYNHGVALLGRDDPDEAERWFHRARREARGDGELRASTAYNLGWTAAARADRLEPTEPEEALRLLYQAADWFHEAVQQQPDDAEARHNLEVVLQRTLLLADLLAKSSEGSLEGKLQELTSRQRDVVARSAALLEQLGAESETHAHDGFRGEFRDLSTAQRTVLSDADQLAAEVGQERDASEKEITGEGSTPEQSMRVVELGNVLHYLHRARERMGQTRRQFRQRQGERGYRRASAALVELKRALEQLRDPISILDTLVRDETAVVASTSVLAVSRAPPPELEEPPEPPRWLTVDSLLDAQTSVAERTDELDRRLRAGLESPVQADDIRILEQVQLAAREAQPFVSTGHTHLAQAVEALEEDDLRRALEEQAAGIRALLEARERFLDLKGLIEAIYIDEKRIKAIAGSAEENADKLREESRGGLQAAQEKNLERSQRLARMLEDERENIAAQTEQASEEERAREEQRLQVASELLSDAREAMTRVRDHLGDPEEDRAANWLAVHNTSAGAVRHLEGMRRLFFSIAEHIREVAERQVDLADETQDVAALAQDSAAELAQRLGALVPTQRELAGRSEAIALSLEEQSRQEGEVLRGEEDAEEVSRKLRQAGEHVLAAESEMADAAASMEAEPPDIEETRTSQQTALVELQKALALLVPPAQGQEEGAGQDGDEGDSTRQNEMEGENGEEMDPAQLLQAVRDREAQRRRERAKRQTEGYETVERDW